LPFKQLLSPEKEFLIAERTGTAASTLHPKLDVFCFGTGVIF